MVETYDSEAKLSVGTVWRIDKDATVKPLVQSPPKRQQFCKIREGDWTRGILLTILTKK